MHRKSLTQTVMYSTTQFTQQAQAVQVDEETCNHRCYWQKQTNTKAQDGVGSQIVISSLLFTDNKET